MIGEAAAELREFERSRLMVWAAVTGQADPGSVRFEPSALVRHVGGASSGAGETQAIAARSRVYYARKHRGRVAARLEAAGVALDEATHAVAALTRPATRRGHVAALRAVLAPAVDAS